MTADSNVLAGLAQALLPLMTQSMGRQFGVGMKHDASGTPSTTQYSHGPGGLLTWPGVDQQVFSSVMGADSLIGQIGTRPSQDVNPTYATITGVADATGNEKNGVCDDAPIAGLMSACITTSVFGRYERATPLLDVTRLGQQLDRSDPMDLRLMNSPLVMSGALQPNPNAPGDVLTNEISRKFWERNIAFHRLLAKQVWVGNPANNSAGGGYKEMTGLQLLVSTGYVDAITGTACPSVDSLVTNFASQSITANATNTVSMITNIYHQLNERARRAGVSPVRWVIAMRSNLFYELSAIWPCAYLTFRCTTASASTPEIIDAQDAVRFRDEMRAGRYLLIDGARVEVQFDDGIPEKDGNSSAGAFPRGCFSTDIYFLPMSIQGGTSVLYMDYFQWSNPAIRDALGNMVLGTIDGAFITWPRQTNMCVVWQSAIEPRLVLRTPWLAARIQNVVYCPVQHEPEPFPNDPYYVGGGVTTRSGPSYHSLWAA